MSLSLQELLKLIGYSIIILFAVLSISRELLIPWEMEFRLFWQKMEAPT